MRNRRPDGITRTNERRWSHAVVTGGSSGIGLAMARRLVTEGTAVTIVARNETRLESSAEELRQLGGVHVGTLVADLSTTDGIERTAALVTDRALPVDLLINNAAAGAPAALVDRLDITAEITVGVTAVAVLTHRAVQAMLERAGGAVLNIASGTAHYPIPFAATYGATKAFVVSFSEAVDFELRGTDVHVTTVCPGFTDTGAVERSGGDIAKVPRLLRMTPEAVAAHALDSVHRRERVGDPGFANRAGATVGHHLPHAIVLPAIAMQQRRVGAAQPGRPGLARDGTPT